MPRDAARGAPARAAVMSRVMSRRALRPAAADDDAAQLVAGEERRLGAGAEHQPAAVQPADGGVRLQVHVLHAAAGEGLLVDLAGGGEATGNVAGLAVDFRRDIPFREARVELRGAAPGPPGAVSAVNRARPVTTSGPAGAGSLWPMG